MLKNTNRYGMKTVIPGVLLIIFTLTGCVPTKNQINDLAERQIEMEKRLDRLSQDLEAQMNFTKRDIERIEKNQLLLAEEIQAVRKKNINLKKRVDAPPTGAQSIEEKPENADSLYTLAESTYYQGNYEQAILAYQKFIDMYAKDPRVPDAYLRQGLSLINLGRNKEARFFLTALVDKYPRSSAAKVAREKLKTI